VRRRLVLGATIALAVAGITTGTATAAQSPSQAGFGFAVIGNIPYGASQIAVFPSVVDQINASNSSITSATSRTFFGL
jgi:hypothetical protein